MTTIIGLYSSAPQSGKSTVASFLKGQGFECVSFAAPLKQMTVLLLENLGYTRKMAQYMVHESKESIIPELGNITVRHMLQTLGTEYGRECLHRDIWLTSWEHRAKRAIASGANVVVDDMRFPNEAELILRYGGELWRINRPGCDDTTGHVSEGRLDDFGFLFDRVITNDGSVEDLREAVLR